MRLPSELGFPPKWWVTCLYWWFTITLCVVYVEKRDPTVKWAKNVKCQKIWGRCLAVDSHGDLYGFSFWPGLEISRDREGWHSFPEYCLNFGNEVLRSCSIQTSSWKNLLVERESCHSSCKCTLSPWVFWSVLLEKVDLGCPTCPEQWHGVKMICWHRVLAGASLPCSPLLCTLFCSFFLSAMPVLPPACVVNLSIYILLYWLGI